MLLEQKYMISPNCYSSALNKPIGHVRVWEELQGH